MPDHFICSDAEFEQLFASGEMPPELFNHEAHLRLAWIHIRKYGTANAIEHISIQLQDFVRALGASDKYNTTLTIAAIKIVKHFMDKKELPAFSDFITEHPRLKTGFRELIATHYKTDIFNSDKARQNWLEPDLLPFT